MTQEEKNAFVNILQSFDSLNIQQVLIDFYNATDIDSRLVLGHYTVDGLIKATERVITNFKQEINSDGWSSLSNHATHQEFGNRSLSSDLQNLYNQLSGKQIDGNYITYLDWLIYYQRTNNFWHSTKAISDTDNLRSIESELKTKKELYTKYLNDIEVLKADIIASKLKLDTTVTDKTKEFQVLTENATSSQATLTEINQLLAEGKNKSERLVELVKYSEEKSEEAKTKTEEERKRFDDYKKNHLELVKTLNEKIEGVASSQKIWDEKLQFITEKESFIKAKEDEINNLTGFAAGVSLFHTFQERKKELEKSVEFWQWSIVVIAVFVVAYISILFYVNPSTTINGTSWGIFALNSIKSIPGIILLYFVIKQYNKERAFQEEYAFKSSVSLTLNAFADKLSNGAALSNKDNLIIDSVGKIYETPHIMKEKNGSIFSVRTKPLNEALKNLTEVVKEIKK
jgi:hypothetical protein